MNNITHKNCIIRFPGIYTPWKAPIEHPRMEHYGVVLYQDENEHLTDTLTWRSVRDPFTQKLRLKTVFKSKLAPIITLESGNYSLLAAYRHICDARNIPYNVIFRDVVADVITDENGFLLEIIAKTMNKPQNWKPEKLQK